MTPFVTRWKATRYSRAKVAAKSAVYWYRQRYDLPLGDPRLLATSVYAIEDDFHTYQAYDRIAKGLADEDVYESAYGDESDFLAAANALLGIDGPAADDWEAVPNDALPDLLRALDQVTQVTPQPDPHTTRR